MTIKPNYDSAARILCYIGLAFLMFFAIWIIRDYYILTQSKEVRETKRIMQIKGGEQL